MKHLEMAETDDDPVRSWNDRIGNLRQRGTIIPPVEIDVRRDRPPPPERLSDEERRLWERLTFSRRPGWFAGAEAILESYVTTVLQVQQIETELRKLKPSTAVRY
jgi:hypothetical protein